MNNTENQEMEKMRVDIIPQEDIKLMFLTFNRN